jgi:hypothetical protein
MVREGKAARIALAQVCAASPKYAGRAA